MGGIHKRVSQRRGDASSPRAASIRAAGSRCRTRCRSTDGVGEIESEVRKVPVVLGAWASARRHCLCLLLHGVCCKTRLHRIGTAELVLPQETSRVRACSISRRSGPRCSRLLCRDFRRWGPACGRCPDRSAEIAIYSEAALARPALWATNRLSRTSDGCCLRACGGLRSWHGSGRVRRRPGSRFGTKQSSLVRGVAWSCFSVLRICRRAARWS